MRKHGWFRPHVRGLTAISSTTLREGGGWWLAGSQLDLDFARDRSFNRLTGYNATPNGLLTYTSPSPKMVYGADGVLGYARHNLAYNSVLAGGSTPTSWSAGPSGTREAVASIYHPGETAIRFVAATERPFLQSSTVTVSTGFLTISATVEAVGSMPVRWDHILGGSNAITTVGYYVNGVYAGDGATAPVFAAGDRIAFVASVAVSNLARIGLGPYGVTSGDLTLSAFSFERGICLGDYLPNTSTSAARYDLPIDHDPLTGEALGVLIEEQRTNLLTYSQEFDTVWNNTNLTVTTNATTAPDGTTTADKLQATATAPTLFFRTVSVAGTSATFSIYLKQGSGATDLNTFGVRNSTTATNLLFCTVNYTTGTATMVIGSTGALMTDVGNGWWRLTMSVSGITSGDGITIYAGATGASEASSEYVYMWGAQLEAGSFATSYIPTVASQVTRAADQVSLATSAFNFVDATGTCVVELDTNFDVAAYIRDIVRFTDGSNDYVRPYAYPSRAGLSIVDSSVAQCDISVGSGQATGVPFSLACAWADNDMAAVVNGGTVGVDTSGTMPTGMTTVRIGFGAANTNVLNGHIKRLTYWNSRKPDAELQALSA